MQMSIPNAVRSSARALYRRPGFSATVLLVMALGIGGTTTLFSLVNSILLRPLPYSDPERLVDLWQADPARGVEQDTLSIPDLFDLRERQKSFTGVAAYRYWQWTMNVSGQEPEQVVGGEVSSEFLSVLGVTPALGRGFMRTDTLPGAEKTLLLDHAFWSRRFGADPGVVGERVEMDDEAYRVIGVLPASFISPTGQQEVCWLPLQVDPATAPRDVRWLRGFARLRSGVSLAAANRELRLLMAQLEAEHPDQGRGRGAYVVPLAEDVVGDVKPSLHLLFAAMAMVLLIALGNITGLLLARGIGRRRELAIRLTLGTSRGGLVRLLMVETLILFVAAGGLGFLLAELSLRALPAVAPAGLPRLAEVRLDLRAALFALALTFACGLLVGLFPALRGAGFKANKGLQIGSGARATGPSVGEKTLWRLLAASEIALSTALLIGSGLLVKSFYRLQQVDLGFNPQNMVTLDLVLPASRYPPSGPDPLPPRLAVFQQRLFEQVRAVPGVAWVSTAVHHPFARGFDVPVTFADRPPPRPGQEDHLSLRPVSEDYLRVTGTRLLRGRFFTAADDRVDSQLVVVINQALSSRYFSGGGVGRRLSFYGKPREIVGVIGDERFAGAEKAAPPAVYPPFLQAPIPWFRVLVRATVRPQSLIPGLQHAIWRVDPRLAISNIGPMQDLVDNARAQRRSSMVVLCLFACFALILSAVGIYGLMAFLAAQRTSEVGLRLAIGANRGEIFRLILGEGVRVLLGGLVAGWIVASGATRLLASQLYGVGANDGTVLVVALWLVASFGLLACVVPCLRSIRVDPLRALNSP